MTNNTLQMTRENKVDIVSNDIFGTQPEFVRENISELQKEVRQWSDAEINIRLSQIVEDSQDF